MDRLFDFSIEEQIACVAREMQLRGKVYGRWIEQKKMTRTKAEHEFRCMQAVRNTLVGLRDAEKAAKAVLENPFVGQEARNQADL